MSLVAIGLVSLIKVDTLEMCIYISALEEHELE
jgi:hypothetical protein